MVIPFIKRNSLNPNEFSSPRPISNLSFLSKIIEESIAIHLERYLLENNLYLHKQSRYRRHHSTETVLIKIFNDVCLSSFRIIFGFDKIDHEILLERLQTRFGFTCKIPKWLGSYLTEWQQFVNIDGFQSDPQTVRCGVHQGSLLGPLLFSLYADDTQLYIYTYLKQHKRKKTKIRQESCLADLSNWFSANKLVCNPNKSNIVYFSTKYREQSSFFYIIRFFCLASS